MVARASGWCASTLPLPSTVASVPASSGAMIPTRLARMPGAFRASRRCERSTAHHPSNGSAMLVSRSFVCYAGMRRSSSAAVAGQLRYLAKSDSYADQFVRRLTLHQPADDYILELELGSVL